VNGENSMRAIWPFCQEVRFFLARIQDGF
jgi:hypothetical protein